MYTNHTRIIPQVSSSELLCLELHKKPLESRLKTAAWNYAIYEVDYTCPFRAGCHLIQCICRNTDNSSWLSTPGKVFNGLVSTLQGKWWRDDESHNGTGSHPKFKRKSDWVPVTYLYSIMFDDIEGTCLKLSYCPKISIEVLLIKGWHIQQQYLYSTWILMLLSITMFHTLQQSDIAIPNLGV